MIDATIKCDIDQVEKMIPVMIDVPTQASPRQRTKIESPQMTHYRFHERFRWPVDQVLVVGLGMVALPIPVDGAPLVPGVPLPIGNTPARADLLIFVECKGAGRAGRQLGGRRRELRCARRRTTAAATDLPPPNSDRRVVSCRSKCGWKRVGRLTNGPRYRRLKTACREFRRVSEWLAATLEMWCPVRGCGFEPRALRLVSHLCN